MPQKRKTTGGSIIPEFVIADGKGYKWKGLNTASKDPRSIDRSATYDSINWITGRDGDHVELRRGQALLGTTRRNIANQHVSGIGVGIRNDGHQVPFFSYGRSLLYYNDTDTVEVSNVNILPAAANDEDINFMPYANLAGSFIYATSPNSSIYKIAVSSPGSVSDQQSQSYRFGFAKINRSRMFGFQRKGILANSFDNTGLYLSYIDKANISNYDAQTVDIVLGSGDGVTKTFSGASIPPTGGYVGAGRQTVFQVIIAAPINSGTSITGITQATNAKITSTAHGLVLGDIVMILGIVTGMPEINGIVASVTSVVDANNVTVSIASSGFAPYASGGTLYKVESFNDDKSGNLNSNLGGTGKINYVTGAWNVTFNTAPINLANDIIMNLYYEDSTQTGVCDFRYNATTRVGGTGDLFRQDDGGGMGMAVAAFQGVEYCFHLLKSWLLTLDNTDTNPTNEPYFEQIGIPYPRAQFATGDGVLFLNNVNPAQPTVSILEIPPGSTNLTVVPVPISQDLDLSVFAFDTAIMYRWGEYDILSCRNYTNGIRDSFNSVTFVRNIFSGNWDRIDYEISCLTTYNGTLLSGDSLSPNLFTLFSGFDDDGQTIVNHRSSSYSDLEMDGMKTVNYLNISGLIQPSQKLQVWISLDEGNYVLAFTILGNGAYVSHGNPVGVGSFTSGSTVVGSGGSQIFANPFELDIPLHTDRFEYISVELQAVDVGYVQVNKMAYKDIRLKRQRLSSYQNFS